jgi:chemotaxis protein methyltransferase CheR
LLSIDELNAGAHYVLALCREQAGDRDAAAEYDRIAAYLDPAFAMPRLHLGLLARRSGDRDAARREFAQALMLLRGEDASRLLLFGGGFHRDGLIALCESSLRDAGGRS